VLGHPAALMEAAVRRRVFPGGVLHVMEEGQTVHRSAHGTLGRGGDPAELATPVRLDTRYDLASLTKPLLTTLVAMRLHAGGALDLGAPVAGLWPRFGGVQDAARRARVRVWHLLAHAAGLPAHRPYFAALPADDTAGSAPGLMEWALDEPLVAEPGTTAVYSDVGFILLGALLERLGGASLEAQAAAVYRALEAGSLASSSAPAGPAARAEIAPTELCAWRGRLLWGEVHDENAAALGGVAGHAGLFGTAADVARVGDELCRALRGESALLPHATVAAFWSRPAVPGSTWSLGWDSPSPTRSSAGRRLSRLAVGHLGFTGTSLWMDPSRRRVVVLLTNRVHPQRSNTHIRALRPRLHDAVVEALDDRLRALTPPK
jgi:CubicO group peptidase (beta-lactamase class C family)